MVLFIQCQLGTTEENGLKNTTCKQCSDEFAVNYKLLFCSESTSDRYYLALYRKMLDPALKTSSKQPMFLNLLYKSMKKDISDRRVQVH